MSSLCPCGSNKQYSECCGIAHLSHQQVTTAEQLMRARYCAHELGLVDFVIQTYHSSCNAEQERQGITDSINSDWQGLTVHRAFDSKNKDEAFVEFSAFFNQDGAQYCMRELSRFIRENNLWFYIDGEFVDDESTKVAETPKIDPRLQQSISALKVGRNDPCICGSGKKFKKCCG